MKSWTSVIGLGLAAFIFVTSEFIPVGLLPEIARGLGKTDAQAGSMMTIYAWIVALMSIPLTSYAAKFDRRPLMLTLVGMFFLASLLSATAPNFASLTAARALVAFTHAVFWAVVTPFGIRLAPRGQREKALAVISTGSTLGSILGIPLGTLIGQLFGWRYAFVAIAVCAAVTGLTLFKILPRTPSQGAAGVKTFLKLLKRRNLTLLYLFVAITMTGQFTAFTFISPYLLEVAHLRKDLIAMVLLAYGCAGVTGSLIAPAFIRRHFRGSALISVALVGFCLLSMRLASSGLTSVIALAVVWGVMFLIVNIVLQNLTLLLAPEAEDLAMAGGSGIYNIGIGTGALFGSLLSANHALSSIGYVGAAFVGVSWFLILIVITSMKRVDPSKISANAI